jgi:hypothetical protein
MAGVTKVHPTAVATEWEQVGKKITFFTVDYIDDISAETGPEELIQAAYHAIQTRATIIAAGPLFNTGSEQTFGVEGEMAAAELAEMLVQIKAAGHNAGTTITAKTLAVPTV